MKRTILFSVALFSMSVFSLTAQTLSPDIYFDDEPGTHNMGITGDGDYYYTCNGGKTYEGKISQYSLNGNFMKSYEIDLDMRSIMYNPGDEQLYVNCYDGNIYMISNLENGSFKLVYSKLYDNEQASLAFGPKGKYLYCLEGDVLTKYDFATGTVDERFNDIFSGSEITNGSVSVAVSKKYMITFNADKQVFYLYDKKGKLKETLSYSKGDYGFSLSYANGHIFVAEDGDYGMGHWYGYEHK